MDPEGKKVGGVESLIKGFIKYAPDDLEIELVGVSTDPSKRPLGKFTDLKIGSKIFKFFPVLCEKNENVKSKIPLSLRFAWALKKSTYNFSDKLIFLHAIESAFIFKNTRAPLFLVIHNDLSKQITGKKGEVLWRRIPFLYFWYERRIMNFVDKIYTESGSTLNLYKSKYPDLINKFNFLPTCFDNEIFYRRDEEKSKLRMELRSNNSRFPQSAKWVIFTGRLQAQKGPERLIESFFEYQKKRSDSILMIIGEGNLKKAAERLADKLNVSDKVHFVGSKEQSEVADYYRAGDVFLMTSYYEGMSVSVLEALACGLPVVSTDVGENGRVVKHAFSGEIVSQYSPLAMADALEKVVSEPDCYRASHCESSVLAYTPVKVLEPVYKAMRQAARERFSQ